MACVKSLLTAQLIAAVVSQSCNVRLLNEIDAGVVLKTGDGQIITAAGFHGYTGYNAFDCQAHPTLFAYNDVTLIAEVTLPYTTDAQQYFTVLTAAPAAGSVAIAMLDMSSGVPDGAGNIDVCMFRVVNGYGGAGVVVGGVSSTCFNCSHPEISECSGPGLCVNYISVDCSVPYSISLVSLDSKLETWTDMPFVEHGVFTVVIQGTSTPEAGATAALAAAMVTDVAGVDTYIPILSAALILAALGVVHKLAGRAIIRYRPAFFVGSPSDSETAAGEDEGSVTLYSFFGWKTWVEAADAAASVLPDADPHGGSPSNLHQSLLARGSVNVVRPPVTAAAKTGVKPGRILSIDTLRGCCLSIMIFVNYGGGNYWFFNHSAWNGLTVADLVFPIFVFTQGVSMAISFASLRKANAPKSSLIRKVVIRAAKLYALGCFVNNGAFLGEFRVLGVLQYFAMAYLVVGLVESLVPVFKSPDEGAQVTPGAWAAIRRDLTRYSLQWAFMFVLAATYLCVQFLLPVPGCPTGYIGAGGLADLGLYQGKGCTGGAHRLVDLKLFSIDHIYHIMIGTTPVSAATCAPDFQCDVYDPEGALGWISAAWMTWLGLQAGRVFVNYRPLLTGETLRHGQIAHIVRLAAWGVAVGVIGGSLAGFAKEGGVIPINKNLWSPSFVLVMASIAYLMLALLFFIVDVMHHWSGAPFRYLGMNSIVVYVGSEILDGFFPFESHMQDTWKNHAEGLTSNIIGVMCWMAVARIMYLKKIFVNV